MQEYVPYIVIGAVAAVLIAVTVLLARAVWRRQVRRYVLVLTGHREAIASALRTTQAVLSALLEGDESALVAFATGDSDERRALAEIAERMRLEHDDLRDIALPKRLWPLADTLCETAGMLAEETARVGDSKGEGVLDALAELDIVRVRAALGEASAEAERLAVIYRVTDSAVYGGGLYI